MMSEEERPTCVHGRVHLQQFIPRSIRNLAAIRRTTHRILDVRIDYEYNRETEAIFVQSVYVLVRNKLRCYFDRWSEYIGDVPVHDPKPESPWRTKLKFVVHYLDLDDIEHLASEIRPFIHKQHGSLRHDVLRDLQRRGAQAFDDTTPEEEDFDAYDAFNAPKNEQEDS